MATINDVKRAEYAIDVLDEKIRWFTSRLGMIRLERAMEFMSFGAAPSRSDTVDLETIYAAHVEKLISEREAIIAHRD